MTEERSVFERFWPELRSATSGAAYAIDGAWNVIEANRPSQELLESFGDHAAEASNILRLMCAPHLLRPQIVNWEEVASSVFRRVRRQLDAPEPPAALAAVVDEIRAYPGVEALLRSSVLPSRQDLFVPLTVRQGDQTHRWMTTLVTVGGALDIALDEMVVECFFPADAETERLVLEAGG